MARFSGSVLGFFRLSGRKSWTRDARTARKAVKRVSAEWLKAAVASKWYLCPRLRFFTAQNLNLLGGSVEKRRKNLHRPYSTMSRNQKLPTIFPRHRFLPVLLVPLCTPFQLRRGCNCSMQPKTVSFRPEEQACLPRSKSSHVKANTSCLFVSWKSSRLRWKFSL